MLISLIRMNNLAAMNNAAYRMMSTGNSLMGLTSFAGNFGDLGALNRKEQMLMADRLNSEFLYKANQVQYDSLEKLEKENIKRTFSTFA